MATRTAILQALNYIQTLSVLRSKTIVIQITNNKPVDPQITLTTIPQSYQLADRT